MGDEFHRPTLTFPDGAYNASQVRLYGLPGSGGLVFPGQSKAAGSSNINVSANLSTGDPGDDQEAQNQIKKLIEELAPNRKMSDIERFRYIIDRISDAKSVAYSYQITLDVRKFGTVILSTIVTGQKFAQRGTLLSCGIIVGYAYEGHCYDLPKPKIMLIPAYPEELPPDDCGYKQKNDATSSGTDRYMVWIVDKLDECVEFEINQGFVEQLVLDANMPGKRSPTMYASRMQMAHRSGRLSE